jgi:hypothetical protein
MTIAVGPATADKSILTIQGRDLPGDGMVEGCTVRTRRRPTRHAGPTKRGRLMVTPAALAFRGHNSLRVDLGYPLC